MAWNDSYLKRINTLIKNPSNFKKVKPFIVSRYLWYKRIVLEIFGIENLSKPYPGHYKLLSYIKKDNGFLLFVVEMMVIFKILLII
jgi:hypothetical protein